MRTPVYRLMSDVQHAVLRWLVVTLKAPVGLSDAPACGQAGSRLISRWTVVDERHLGPIIRLVQSCSSRGLLP